MYRQFCIVLFVVILCNGVTYSSPTNERESELTSKDKKAVSTEVGTQPSHNVQPPTPAPVAENATHHVETPTNHTEADDKSAHKNSTAVANTINQVPDSKSVTQNTSAAAIRKVPSPPSNSSTGNATKPANPIPASLPATSNTTTTDLPVGNYTEMARPITDGQTTTTTLATGNATTTKALPTKPTAATPTPAPTSATSTDNAVLEHNTSQKPQENRFDGASFVGGIVLTIGLTAIGFIAFKYYKSGKIDANYRTL